LSTPQGSKPGEPAPWRAGVDADRRKRPRRINNQRQALRQLTAGAAVAAVGLNAILFAQTGSGQVDAGNVQDAIVSAVESLFPGAGLRPATSPPTSSPNSRPIVTTGGS
jgi:hypothetical protein